MTHADAVEFIYKSDYPVSLKIIRLFALATLNYRQPIGNRAWDCINELTDPQFVEALAFLTGAAIISGGDWVNLVPEIK